MGPNPFAAPPDRVEVAGAAVPVNTDFRVGVAIETELTGENPDLAGLLRLFYRGTVPADTGAAAEAMLRFYAYPTSGNGDGSGGGGGKRGGRFYDFRTDADALLASFLPAYGIDLTAASLHWHTFRRLMLNLPPDTPFMGRVRVRSADLSKLDRETRRTYKRLRALYALPPVASDRPSTTRAERDAAMKERLRRRYAEARAGLAAKAALEEGGESNA